MAFTVASFGFCGLFSEGLLSSFIVFNEVFAEGAEDVALALADALAETFFDAPSVAGWDFEEPAFESAEDLEETGDGFFASVGFATGFFAGSAFAVGAFSFVGEASFLAEGDLAGEAFFLEETREETLSDAGLSVSGVLGSLEGEGSCFRTGKPY